METMRKYLGFTFAIGLLVALGLAGIAPAQDPSLGQAEKVITFSAAVTAGTPALVCTAVSGIAHNVRSVVVSNSAAGTVKLFNDSLSTGVEPIGAFGVIANQALPLTEQNLGPGCVTAKGKGLYVDGTTGTITMTLRIREDKTSPR